MYRRLAVPFAVKGLSTEEENRLTRTRRLKDYEMTTEDIEMLRKISDNKARIDRLWDDIDLSPEMEDSPEIEEELDYINATIELGLLEITGELEEVPFSDELFEEAVV